MRPLTERWPKPVLPIDGRPVIASLLRELAAAGLERAWVVTGHLAEQLEDLIRRGEPWGVDVRFVRQPSPDGSADAVARALDAGAAVPAVVVGADTLFGEGDVKRFVEAWGASGAEGAVAARRDPPPAPPHRWPLGVEDGRVTRILDDDPGNPLAGAPLWVVGPEAAARLRVDRKPWELGASFQAAIDAGVAIAGVEIGKTRDLTDPLDLVEENFPYLA